MCYIIFISHSLHWRYIKIALRKYVITIFSIAVICFKEAREKAALHCINATIRSLQKVPIVRSNIYDFFHWLRIGKVLIHDKSMYLTSNYIRLPIIFEKQCIACNLITSNYMACSGYYGLIALWKIEVYPSKWCVCLWYSFFNLNPVWEFYWLLVFVNFITLITLRWFG